MYYQRSTSPNNSVTNLDDRIIARCRCCSNDEAKMILHILQCPSKNRVHIEHNEIFVQRMREIDAPNHFLKLFGAGIELALMDGDTHSAKEWNGNLRDQGRKEQFRNYWMMTGFLNKTTKQHSIPATDELGWEHLFMGKMASEWRQCWPDKMFWRLSIVHTFME